MKSFKVLISLHEKELERVLTKEDSSITKWYCGLLSMYVPLHTRTVVKRSQRVLSHISTSCLNFEGWNAMNLKQISKSIEPMTYSLTMSLIAWIFNKLLLTFRELLYNFHCKD